MVGLRRTVAGIVSGIFIMGLAASMFAAQPAPANVTCQMSGNTAMGTWDAVPNTEEYRVTAKYQHEVKPGDFGREVRHVQESATNQISMDLTSEDGHAPGHVSLRVQSREKGSKRSGQASDWVACK